MKTRKFTSLVCKNKKSVVSIMMVGALAFTTPAAGMLNGTLSQKVYATDAKKKKAEAQKNLNDVNKKLEDLQKQQSAVESQVDKSTQELAQIMSAQQTLKTEMSDKQREIDKAKKDLDVAKDNEKKQYDAMKKRIEFMYENSASDSIWTAILDSKSFSEMLNNIEYVSTVYKTDRKLVTAYQDAVKKVEDLSNQLQDEMSDLEASKSEYDQQQKELSDKVENLKAQSGSFDAQMAQAKQLAATYTSTISEQNALINQQLAAERAAANTANNRAAARTTTTSRKNSRTSAGAGAGQGRATGGASNGNFNPSGAVSGSVLGYASQFVGGPYKWGGTSLTNGCDCSGFVMGVYAHFGKGLPHSSAAMRGVGQAVSVNNMQPGDIVCYAGHVGIYAGNGQLLSALNSSKGITYCSVNYKPILAVRRL
ncbi:Cell wall-associated hydrolase, NlpC family [Lachnospiraceae bacterium C7]|nr:Cell wall-associated hydrolase, NlpC family [Lachnospiraceae bacterium C7]